MATMSKLPRNLQKRLDIGAMFGLKSGDFVNKF